VILLESSALIESFRKNARKDILARVRHAVVTGQAAVCEPVLLELWAGASGASEKKKIREISDLLPSLDCDAEAWRMARQNAILFRSKGGTFSNFDILIFSIALRHNAGIIAMDKAYAKMRNILNKAVSAG
jgi:predicted nucleic acid-binding protein